MIWIFFILLMFDFIVVDIIFYFTNTNYNIVIIDLIECIDYKDLKENIKILKQIAVDYNLSIVITKHLSREIQYREDKIPLLTDMDFNQYCDNVLFIYRDEYYNAPYVKDGNWGGVNYIPEYKEILPFVEVEVIALKKDNIITKETYKLLFNRGIGKYYTYDENYLYNKV